MAPLQLLQRLPEELLQDVIERLDKQDLYSFNLLSRWCHQVATRIIWREVELVDCRTRHENHEDAVDEHDDTPLLKKLLILAKNPWIASGVQILTHRCHLPPPAIFNELPRTPFSGQTLSPDPRTTKLVQLAVQHMNKVHTLRIIFGHPNINDALLRSLFNKNRKGTTRIRRLWLENCRISVGCDLRLPEHALGLPLELDFAGLESIRLRRLPIRIGQPVTLPVPAFEFVHARSKAFDSLQNGEGGQSPTTINWLKDELAVMKPDDTTHDNPDETHNHVATLKVFHTAMLALPFRFDDRIYDNILKLESLPAEAYDSRIESHHERSELAYRGSLLDPDDLSTVPQCLLLNQRERTPSSDVALKMLSSASATLTSLCLDWVLTLPYVAGRSRYRAVHAHWVGLFTELFSLRFPSLRALQFRNAVVPDTMMPAGFCLLDHSTVELRNAMLIDDDSDEDERLDLACLTFMEAHPKLQCLAWPMESFFSEKRLSPDISNRVEAVIDNLGRTLVDLRVDALYSSIGELQSESSASQGPRSRERRRRFIADFASKMTKVESIKIEGGIPRDERREVIRALHACPLKKVVMIGVCSPIGNTWGTEGRDLNETLRTDELEALEPEHKDVIHSIGPKTPDPIPDNFVFEPIYGWPPGPPMIHTIAQFHADTVMELKFCGYKGAPVLFTPTPITSPMLAALKHFNNLKSLIMSTWLSTEFEGERRDSEIIRYWLDARTPESTSLMRITDEEPEGWEKELRTKYAPDALAWEITSFIGPFLSEHAKARSGGVHVRGSVCIGDWGGIFDIDLWIGKGSVNSDVCLGYKGPREELEPERRQTKLESRRWF